MKVEHSWSDTISPVSGTVHVAGRGHLSRASPTVTGITVAKDDREETLANGVARLHSWYQVVALGLVLLEMWYSEELAQASPTFRAFFDLFVNPVVTALRVDMYLGSSDYKEVFGHLVLRHRMLMIVQSVVLGLLLLLLLKSGAGEGGDEDDDSVIHMITDSKGGRWLVRSLEILEVVFVVRDLATKSVLQEMVPSLDASVYNNIVTPCWCWGRLVGSWWLTNIVPASVMALVYRVGVLVVTGRYSKRPWGVRWYYLTFLLSKIAVSLLYWWLDFCYLGFGTMGVMVVKAVVVYGTINLQNQKEGVHRVDVTIPWDRDERPIRKLTALYFQRFRRLLFQPLLYVLGLLVIMLSANTLSILVVILGMLLFLLWGPAAISSFSTDFFFNVAAAASAAWFLRFANGVPTADNLVQMVQLFSVVVLVFTAIAYLWGLVPRFLKHPAVTFPLVVFGVVVGMHTHVNTTPTLDGLITSPTLPVLFSAPPVPLPPRSASPQGWHSPTFAVPPLQHTPPEVTITEPPPHPSLAASSALRWAQLVGAYVAVTVQQSMLKIWEHARPVLEEYGSLFISALREELDLDSFRPAPPPPPPPPTMTSWIYGMIGLEEEKPPEVPPPVMSRVYHYFTEAEDAVPVESRVVLLSFLGVLGGGFLLFVPVLQCVRWIFEGSGPGPSRPLPTPKELIRKYLHSSVSLALLIASTICGGVLPRLLPFPVPTLATVLLFLLLLGVAKECEADIVRFVDRSMLNILNPSEASTAPQSPTGDKG